MAARCPRRRSRSRPRRRRRWCGAGDAGGGSEGVAHLRAGGVLVGVVAVAGRLGLRLALGLRRGIHVGGVLRVEALDVRAHAGEEPRVGVVGGGRDVHARHAVRALGRDERARADGGVVVEEVLQRRQPVAIERLGKVVLLRVLAVRAFLEQDELGAAHLHAQALQRVVLRVHVQGGLRRLRKVIGLVPAVGVDHVAGEVDRGGRGHGDDRD